MSIKWSGVFPAVTTKFTDNDELDFDAFDKNIAAQLKLVLKVLFLAAL